MPPLVIPRAIQVRFIWQLFSVDQAVNVLHYDAGPSTFISQSDATAYAAMVGAALVSSGLQGELATQVQLDRITLRDIRTANLPEFVAQVDVSGTNAGQPLPAQTALVATLRTAKAGRSFRGRYYQFGISENSNATGLVAAAATVTALTAFMNTIGLPIIEGQEWALAVASRTLLELNPVTSVSVDGTWDTQRRRVRAGI